MLKPRHDNNESMYQGGEGNTPVTTALFQSSLRGKPPTGGLESKSDDLKKQTRMLLTHDDDVLH